MARIFVDMDEVLADSSAKLADMFEAEFGLDVRQQVWEQGCKVYDLAPEGLRTYVRDYLHRPGFFADLAVFENAQAVLKRLNEVHEVYICSAAVEFPQCLVDKMNWLQTHFPFLSYKQVIFCGGRKKFLLGDYLIDDHLSNISSFEGTGLLFHASHNKHDTRFVRMQDWKGVEEYFFGELG